MPKETAGMQLAEIIDMFASFFECKLGVLGTKRGELNEKKSDKVEKSDEHDSFSVLVGVRKVSFLRQHVLVWFSKMCFPPRAGVLFENL